MDKCIQILSGHDCSVYCLTSHNGSLYSCDEMGWIVKWDGIKYIKLQSRFKGHRDGVQWMISSDDHLYSCGGDDTIKKWKDDINVERMNVIVKHEYEEDNDCIIKHDGYIYSCSNVIRKWKDGKCIKVFGVIDGYNIWYLLSRNNHLYSCGSDGNIRIWKNDECIEILKGHDNSVYCLTFHENYLYSGGQDGTIRKWKDNENIRILIGHSNRVICLTSYNDCLYSGGADDVIRIWKDDNCVKILRGHIDWILPIIVHNGYIYSGGHDSTIIKWGEYYPHQYQHLPDFQKEKIKNWRKVKTVIGVQKDIHFLFERELLV